MDAFKLDASRPDCARRAWRSAARKHIVWSFMRTVVDRPKLVPDAHLAALAIEHGLTLYSTDRDFARFPGVRWQHPFRPDP